MEKVDALRSAFLAILMTAAISGQVPDIGNNHISKAQPAAGTAAPSSAMKIDPDFGRMPLYFIPNTGQMDERVAYYTQGKDKALYFTSEGITLALLKPAPRDVSTTSSGRAERAERMGTRRDVRPDLSGAKDDGPPDRWAVKIDFIGANRESKPLGEAKTEAVVSYFKGKPEEWKAGLPTYSKLVYPGLWAGIDLVYHGTVNRLKYEFIVHPGADPSTIKLAYRGAGNVSIDENRRLHVETPLGSWRDEAPAAYQEKEGKRTEIGLDYRIEGKPSDAEKDDPTAGPSELESYFVGFRVGDYDRSLPLVLDPAVLFYCGYIGGSSDEYGYAVAADGAGNAYITGSTSSTEATFPVTAGPDLTYNGGVYDAFVAKVNSSGNALVYCSFIGGISDSDTGRSIAADSAGNAYVTGSTSSNEVTFPVALGPDVTHNGGADVFVAKVNPSGTALSYCGYIGGASDEEGRGIAVDSAGNAYVVGSTWSNEATFPVNSGPDLTYNGASRDVFVAKVDSSGTGLSYCGYIGGSNIDLGYAIAVDSAGNAYVTGETSSAEATFPVTTGPDLSYNGNGDCFVAKVNSSGTGLSYCGYIGGSDLERGEGIGVDSAGNAYIAGPAWSSQSKSFPVKVGPDLTFNGGIDAFVAKVDSSGTALSYCGYVGGYDWDVATGIAVDSAGNEYITGYTYTPQPSFPVVIGPDLTHNGGMDAFVAKVNSSGIGFSYCGYIGGSGFEQGFGVALDRAGNAYIAGYTSSTEASFPVKTGPDSTYNSGYSDAFVAKIYYYDQNVRRHAAGDFDGDGADEIVMDFGSSGAWMWDAGVWTQLTASNPENQLAANVDGNADDEILLDLGASGLWLWNGGAWAQLSSINVDTLAAGDTDADGSDDAAADFGTSGLWLWNGGAWSQLSGADIEYLAIANLNGAGGAEIIGDFGSIGLWVWSGGGWTQLSGVNADSVAAGNTDGVGGEDLVGDFGPFGLWLFSSGVWTQLSGVNADSTITADIDGSGDKEIIADFALTGLWLWDSGSWTQLSGVNADDMIAADVDGDGDDEIIGDFSLLGLWLWNGGSWSQLSGVNPEGLLAGDIDGDSADELIIDFGSTGVWLWDGGAWSKISTLNPD